jgi:2-haloacid dehalogenase
VGPQAESLSELWRAKQLECTWTRSLMGAYRDFDALIRDALDFAAARCGGISAEARGKLLNAYETLDAYAERGPGAGQDHDSVQWNAGWARTRCPFGRTGGLARPVALGRRARLFKTAPAVYRMVCDLCGFRPEKISFQSSSRWDVAGATKFGFRTVWINRSGAPDEYLDLPPPLVAASIPALLDA